MQTVDEERMIDHLGSFTPFLQISAHNYGENKYQNRQYTHRKAFGDVIAGRHEGNNYTANAAQPAGRSWYRYLVFYAIHQYPEAKISDIHQFDRQYRDIKIRTDKNKAYNGTAQCPWHSSVCKYQYRRYEENNKKTPDVPQRTISDWPHKPITDHIVTGQPQ